MTYNIVKIFLFLLCVSAVILLLGYIIYDRQGLLVAFAVVVTWNVYIYLYSDQKLRHLFSTQKMEGFDPWKIHQTVRELADQASIPSPDILITSLSTPTAFSVGQFKSYIVISKSLAQILTPHQLKAVLAHEIFHIKKLDTLAFGVGSVIMNAFLFLGHYLDQCIAFILRKKQPFQQGMCTYLLMPLATMCLKKMINIQSDYEADQFAQQVCGDPQHLAQALWKLHSYAQTKPIVVPPSTAHLFIVNPLDQDTVQRYFHYLPSVENRIRRLINRYPI